MFFFNKLQTFTDAGVRLANLVVDMRLSAIFYHAMEQGINVSFQLHEKSHFCVFKMSQFLEKMGNSFYPLVI